MNKFGSVILLRWLLLIILTTIGCTASFSQKTDKQVLSDEAVQTEIEAKRLSMQWDEKYYRQSILAYEKSARNWNALDNDKNYANCLRESAKLKLILNENDDAWQLLLSALESDRKAKNVSGESETLSILTIIASRNNKLEISGNYHKKAVSLAEKVENPETIALASFASAEYYYRNQRNIPLMIKSLEKSIILFREAENKVQESLTLTELAYASVMNNDRIQGQLYATQAVEIARTSQDKRSLAFALIALGDAHQRVGNWDVAFQSFKEAESIFPENLDLLEKAILLDRFGVYYETFGDLVQSRIYYRKAQDLFIRIGNLFGSSELSSVIGKISLELGETEVALTHFNEGLKISKESKDLYSLAYTYENLGDLCFYKQEYNQSLDNYQKSLANLNKVGIKHVVASVYEKLGKLYARQGKIDLAESYFSNALKINRKIRSKAGEASTLYNLAINDRSKNNINSSLEKITESLRVTELLNSETSNLKLKQSYFAGVFERYELYINLLMQKHTEMPNAGFALQALQAAEKSRARAMLETLRMSEAKISADADPELIRREREVLALLNTKADKLTEVLSGNTDQSEIKKLDDEVNTLKNELAEIKAIFKENSPIYSEIKNPEAFDIIRFQNEILDENTLLLEFSLGKNASYLWLVGKNDFTFFELPSQKIIEPKVRKLLELLTEREMHDGEVLEDYQARLMAAESEYQQKAKELSNELLGKVSDKLANKRLLIVADGILNYFPLSALPAPNSDELLIAKNEIVYQPSASTISILQTRQNKTASKDVLVFADAIFSPNDARVNAEKNNTELTFTTLKDGSLSSRQFESVKSLPRLDASQTEAASISEIFGASRSLIISGAKARRERVLEPDLADYRIVHFATHGLLDEEHPEFSSIVFSLYDEKGDALKGFLRLQDIYNLNLASDLVVLSACDSAIGKEIKGEGVISLTRGFMQAGSKSVLSSLWKAEDNATAELMKIFYSKLLNEGLTPAQALRRAQLEMSQNPRYRSPFYWAAFTLQGEYRYEFSKPSFFQNYSIYIGLTIAAILGFGGIFAYRKFY